MWGRLVYGVLETEIPGGFLDGSLDGRVLVDDLMYPGPRLLLPELFRHVLQLGADVPKPILEPPERGAEKISGAVYGLILDELDQEPGQVLRVFGHSSSRRRVLVAWVPPSYPHPYPFRCRMAGRQN